MAESEKEFNPRPYMELAIEEMNKSNNEPRIDGKIPPKVGAILLFPDGTVKRAHRGELRDGDHAEFALLERKLADKKLDDCILFTTLEPCVKRNPPKIECCKRVTKARIKTVYVGISDPDPTVDGKGIKHLEKHGVKVIMFDSDLQKIIFDENAKFREQAIERKKSAEKDELQTPLEKVLPATDISQFSNEALTKFIKEAKLNFTIDSPDFHDYLANIGVLGFDAESKAYKPTGMGILLFGENPRSRFSQAAFMAHAEYDSYKIHPETFSEALVLIPEKIENWLKTVLGKYKDTSSFKRKDIPDFPIEILREAIINAIVHRDYTDNRVYSSISIDNDKVIVKSPGEPLPSITIDQLNTFNAPSINRNPIIAYVFSLMNFMEEKGLGMKSFKSLSDRYDLPLPQYSLDGPYLSLIFPRSFDAVGFISGDYNLADLNIDELKGFYWIRIKREVTSKEFAQHFGFNEKKAQRYLAKYKNAGLINLEGRGPGATYCLANK
ncbi:MAG: hypothetical protein LLG13_18025 [Bacteroidales bacterium]|nr:hypothetical protein [Bacteroidales bacterium]